MKPLNKLNVAMSSKPNRKTFGSMAYASSVLVARKNAAARLVIRRLRASGCFSIQAKIPSKQSDEIMISVGNKMVVA